MVVVVVGGAGTAVEGPVIHLIAAAQEVWKAQSRLRISGGIYLLVWNGFCPLLPPPSH